MDDNFIPLSLTLRNGVMDIAGGILAIMTPAFIVGLFLHYRYAVFIPLAIFEGTIVSLLAGVLVALGVFNPIIAYSVLIVGDLIPDTLWYQIGRHAHRRDLIGRFGHHVGMTPGRLQFIIDLWHTRPLSTLTLSKLAYGMAAPMLMSAGYSRMPLKTYYGISVSVSAVQYGVLMCIGASMYRSYVTILPYIEHAELAAAGIIAVVLALAWRTSSVARKQLLSKE